MPPDTDPEAPGSGLDLDRVRATFEDSTDFTIGLEEEFALLDPETLELEHRFPELFEAAQSDEVLAPAVRGELIDTEIEIRSGRGETFAEAVERQRERRDALFALAESKGLALAAMGTHPWANYLDQRIIDTEHYRRLQHDLGWVAQRNNSWSLHVHVGIRGADRAMAVANHLRSHVPILLALSCSSPWLEGRITHLRSTRTQIFTRMFPRCGVPDVFADWADYDRYVRFLLETESIREHTEIWWTVRPHQSFGTVEVRACDALPDIGQSIALAALQTALAARAARLYDAGELPPPDRPSDIEENLWRALRWGTDRGQIDLVHRRVVSAADHARALLEACAPEVDALGLAPWLEPLGDLLQNGDHASRWKARVEAGEDMSAIHAEQVEITMASARRLQEVLDGR